MVAGSTSSIQLQPSACSCPCTHQQCAELAQLSKPAPNQHQTMQMSPKVSFLLVWPQGLSSGSDKDQSHWSDTRRKAGGGWHHTTKLTFRVSGTHHRTQDGTDRRFVLHRSVKNKHFVERSRTHSWVIKGRMANNLRRDEIFLSVSLWQRLSQTWLTEGGHQHYPQLNLGSGHSLMQAWLWSRAEALLFVWVCVRKYNQNPSGSIVHLEKGAHNGQHHHDSEDKSQDHHW